MHEYKLGEATGAHALHNRVTFCIGDRRLGIEGKLCRAGNRVTHAATVAMSARANQRDNNVLSHFDSRDISAHFFDNTSTLMTIDGWQCAAPRTLCVSDIAVTNRDSRNLDANFARTSIGKLHFFNDEWLTKLATHCCFHRIVLPFGSEGFKRTHLM